MHSRQTVEDLAVSTPAVTGSTLNTAKEEVFTTPERTTVQIPTNTLTPESTPRATNTPVPTVTQKPTATETVLTAETSYPQPTKISSAIPTLTPTPTPTPEGLTLEIVLITSPVLKGDNASLTAQTAPGAQCQITVYYKSGPSKAKGLDPLVADASGKATWTWKVGSATTAGNWRIVVKANLEGLEINKEVYFTVQ